MKLPPWLLIAGAAVLAFFFLRKKPAGTAGPTLVTNRPEDTPPSFLTQLSNLFKQQTVPGTMGSSSSGGSSPFRIGGSSVSLDLTKAVSGISSLIGGLFSKTPMKAASMPAGTTQAGRVSDTSLGGEIAGLTSPFFEDWYGGGGIGVLPATAPDIGFFDFGGYEFQQPVIESQMAQPQTWVDVPDAFFDWSAPDVFGAQEGMV